MKIKKLNNEIEIILPEDMQESNIDDVLKKINKNDYTDKKIKSIKINCSGVKFIDYFGLQLLYLLALSINKEKVNKKPILVFFNKSAEIIKLEKLLGIKL